VIALQRDNSLIGERELNKGCYRVACVIVWY